MAVNVPRLFISATKKSSGKTLLSIGITAALTRRGLKVQPFKKGLDYIDPMWLTAAAEGVVCRNLDIFVMGVERIQANFARYAQGADLALVEGNLGFFDGQDPGGNDCGAALAAQLKAPSILVVDCKGLHRGVAPLVMGHRAFPGGESIAGIILNNVASPRQEQKLKTALGLHCDLPILGVVPRSSGVRIDERHLGLVPAQEEEGRDGLIREIADLTERYVDLDAVLAVARGAESLEAPALIPPTRFPGAKLRIGMASDAAFHFYYPENLEALEAAGAELVPVSMMEERAFPSMDGFYIGGGFPEMFLDRFSLDRSMLESLKMEVDRGLPVYAECGGLMALSRAIRWGERRAPMAGALPFEVEMKKKPQGHGYMVIEATGACLWPPAGTAVRCHEFHYSRAVDPDPGLSYAYRVTRGTGLGNGVDGVMHKRVLASYAHIHVDGAPDWADFLVEYWRRG